MRWNGAGSGRGAPATAAPAPWSWTTWTSWPGWSGANGFAIGTDTVHTDPSEHDRRDADLTMRTLREAVAALYYRHAPDGLPHEWIGRMKRSISTLAWRFNADRMVRDYTLGCYLPAAGGALSDIR